MSKTDSQSITSAIDLIGKSVALVRDNIGSFAAVSSVSILLTVLSATGDKNADTTNLTVSGYMQAIFGISAAVFALLLVGAVVLQVMATALELKAAAGKKPSLGELWESARKYTFRYIGMSILVGLVVVGGFILLIIPGFIALTRLFLTPYVMMHEDLGIVDSMRRSSEISKGNAGAIWGVIGVMILVSAVPQIIIGMFSPLVAGVASSLAAIAYSVAPALRYLELKKLA